MIRRVALALATAILPLTLLVFSVVPASAGTGTPCYQSSCNGLDPTTSYNRYTGYECNSGASPVPGQGCGQSRFSCSQVCCETEEGEEQVVVVFGFADGGGDVLVAVLADEAHD